MQEALIASAVTLLLATLGAVWHISALASKLFSGWEHLRGDMSEIREGLKKLEEIPVLHSKVTQLEHAASKMASTFPGVLSRLDVLESKVVSLKEYRLHLPKRDDK